MSFNIVSVGIESYIFDFAAFIEKMKGWSRDLAEDDDDDKVEENFEEKVDFDFSLDVFPIFPLGARENKNWEFFVVCWFKYWREWFV